MNGRMSKVWIVGFCFLIATAFTVTSAMASEASQKQYNPKLPSSISLGNNSYARLVNSNMIPSDTGKTLMTTFRFYNGGNKSVSLLDYWIRYKKKNSSQSFTAQLLPADKEKTKLAPKSQTYVSFYTTTGSDITLSNLEIEVIKWDFSMPNYEKILGKVSLGAEVFVAPASTKYEIQISGSKLNTSVDKMITSKGEQSYKSSVYYTIENQGKTSVTIPQLQYNIITSEGIVYPLTANQGSTEIILNPKQSKTFILKGSLSTQIKESGWKLVVSQKIAADSKVMVPFATYLLPKSNQATSSDFNKVLAFTDSNGSFSIKINSVHRLPLEDQDILASNITITNTDSEPLPVPNLVAKYVLDKAVERTAELIQPNKLLSIKPNQSITIYLYSLIPYTYDFSQTKLILQEKGEGENAENTTLLEIEGANVLSDIPKLSLAANYKIHNVGSESSFQLLSTRTYEGTTANVFTAQVDVTNLGQRFANVTQLAAFFKSVDGTIYQAVVSDVSTKMAPGGRTFLDVEATVPKTTNMQNAVLIIGEAVEKSTTTGNQPTTSLVGYVNPVELELPSEEQAVQGLSDINLYPYNLSISKIKSSINYGEAKLIVDFNYDMERDPLVQANMEGKKIIIEVKDEKNGISFTNGYSFEKAQTDNGAAFLIGEHQGQFTATDSDLIFKIQTMQNNFTFNVYEEIHPGQKKLLASKEIAWFTTSE